jgi:hypothetical protein
MKTCTVSFVIALFWISTLVASPTEAYSQSNGLSDTVYITDFGIQPDSRQNAVPAVQRALEKCRSMPNAILYFPRGRYDFWPQHAVEKVYFESNTTDNNPKRNAIFIYGMQGLKIEGGGSSFIYHDRIQPFTIDSSRDIIIQNLSIDWDIPLTAQAEVLDTGSNFVDLQIDEQQYPFIIEKGKLVFVGEGWKSAVFAAMDFDRGSHRIAYRTGDSPGALGAGWRDYQTENLGGGRVRLQYHFKRLPQIGNILVLRHSARDHAMVFIRKSDRVQIDHVTGYHCAGLGMLSQYSSNLSFTNVAIIPNQAKHRYFSGHDDGLHFSNCGGNILVDSCRFAGLMDDPINIHGTYVRIIEKRSDHVLLCRFMEHMSVGMEWGRKGEEIAYINHHTLQTIGHGRIDAFRRINDTDFELTVEEPIPADLELNSGLENLSWTPAAIIRNSVFESCRARGILITTPKPVLVENNQFMSSGSAILIAGDVNSWYESGACNDVLIRNNEFFDPVNTSEYQFTEAMISIYPEIPVMNAQTPPYHRNIRIEQNRFHAFDYPILFAQSVEGLSFSNNKLIRSYAFRPYHRQKATISLSGCRKVRIFNNTVDDHLLGKNLRYRYMKKNEIRCQSDVKLETWTEAND